MSFFITATHFREREARSPLSYNGTFSRLHEYESKDVQVPPNITNKLADLLSTSVVFLISGDNTEKAKASLKNSERIQRFNEVDYLPEKEQYILIKIVSSYVRNFRAKHAFAS